MNGKLSPRDYEALSAYLDGELSPKECARLKFELQSDEKIRKELSEIKKTRTMLRSQPRLRAPRNFTLTPQMAGVRSHAPARPGAYPVFRLASMLAALFLIVVMVGDFVGSSMQPTTIAMSETSGQAAPAFPGFGMGGGGGGGSSSEPARPVPQEAVEVQPEVSAAAAKDAAQSPALSSDAALQAPDSEQSQPENTLRSTAEKQVQTVWPILRILQVVLALIAVATGLAALVLRRKLA